jgi:hypothetical protein
MSMIDEENLRRVTSVWVLELEDNKSKNKLLTEIKILRALNQKRKYC